ncbi:D-aminoacyl-tRNA deacylase [soil metagenome]
MRALVQRVIEAQVTVDGAVVGQIRPGLLVLLGVRAGDAEQEAEWLAAKTARLRIFADEEGRMNKCVSDIDGQVLVVSQFTLYGDAQKGNRPSFVEAAEPVQAQRLYEHFVAHLEKEIGRAVPTGSFGAMMQVSLVNDGPVTILLER